MFIPKKDVILCLEKILRLDVYIDSKKILIQALECYKQNSVDWTDCLNMFLMKEEGVTDVYSYDRGLSKFDWINRLEP